MGLKISCQARAHTHTNVHSHQHTHLYKYTCMHSSPFLFQLSDHKALKLEVEICMCLFVCGYMVEGVWAFFPPKICILFSKKSKVDCSHSHNKSKSYWLVYCLKELHLQIVFAVQLFSTLALKKCNACVYLWGWFQWVESPVLVLLPLFKLKGRVTLQKLLKALVPFYHWWIVENAGFD